MNKYRFFVILLGVFIIGSNYFLPEFLRQNNATTIVPSQSGDETMQLTKDNKENIKNLREEVKNYFDGNKILQELMLTQAILESGLNRKTGPSLLAVKDNNLFGIKGKGTDGSVERWTMEQTKKGLVKVKQYFAKNKTVDDSLKQHETLLNKPRYKKVKEAKTFADAAKQVRLAGYATNSEYTQLLIDTHKTYVKG